MKFVVRLHEEHQVHVRRRRVVQVGDDLPRLADRGLEPGLESGQALDPVVDDAERDRREVVGVDADVELIEDPLKITATNVPASWEE